MSADDPNQADFCRVCRCEGTTTRPLFHPCMCTGSIKYIHQDCLLRWLHYSKRHTCELCNHRFTFAPIYASGTPRFLPVHVLFAGLVRSLRRSVLNWIHLILVFLAWLIVVPLTACRIYRCLFTGSVSSLLTLPLDMLSTRHLVQDCLQGFTIVILALAAFLGYISLREQLLQGGGPAWLEQDDAGGNDVEANGRRHVFPDLFNLFGGANLAAAAAGGVGAAAPVPPANGQVAAAAEAGPHLPEHHPVPAEPPSNATDQPISSVTDLPSHLSSASTDEGPAVTHSEQSPNLSMQPQQFGWRAEGLGREEDSAREAQADSGADPAHEEPDFDDGLAGGDGAGIAADAGGFGEAMNWDRLLGLDGSLAFIEHVLWLIALNTLFIVIFAFCPYHMGQFTVVGFKLEKLVALTHMEGLSTSIIGYLIVAGALVLFQSIFRFLHMPTASYWTGLCYVYIKVALVSLLELGIFPVLCGLWIDACTLSLFNSTLTHRATVLHHAPMAFAFIHWAMGMLYIFYMASLLVLARSVVRPGVLRFVYHFNDPDFKPIQDMIMQPLHIYLQRLVATYSIWGILIVLMLWLPLELIRRTIPGFLPYQINVAHESPLDYSVEIILIQVVLPFLLDAHAKATVRQWLRAWCVLVSRLLNIRSFLLGDVPLEPGDFIITEDGQEVSYNPPGGPHDDNNRSNTESELDPRSPEHPISTFASSIHDHHPEASSATRDNLPQAHEAPQRHREADSGHQPPHEPPPVPPAEADDEMADGEDDFTRFVPYKRTSYFTLRMIAFLLIVLVSLMLLSTTLLVLPVGVGRFVFRLISSKATQKHDAVALVTGFTLLGFLLRIAACLPVTLLHLRRSFAAFLVWASQLFCWSRRLHVLRIWTRSGTTCEISIPRPALPAPVRATVAAPGTNGCSGSGNSTATLASVMQRALGATRVVVQLGRLSCVAVVLFLVLPVALGLLINLVFITPFQVGPYKSLIIGFWEHWIFGIMHLKVAVLMTMAGPSWWLRRRLEAVQNELLTQRHNARCVRILSETAPLVVGVGLSLASPYLLAHYVGPWLNLDSEFALRYVYPTVFLIIVVLVVVILQIKQLQKLYTRIKDEKYLIGRRLVNCGQARSGSDTCQALTPSTSQVM